MLNASLWLVMKVEVEEVEEVKKMDDQQTISTDTLPASKPLRPLLSRAAFDLSACRKFHSLFALHQLQHHSCIAIIANTTDLMIRHRVNFATAAPSIIAALLEVTRQSRVSLRQCRAIFASGLPPNAFSTSIVTSSNGSTTSASRLILEPLHPSMISSSSTSKFSQHSLSHHQLKHLSISFPSLFHLSCHLQRQEIRT
jgi:hypothetical protein